MLRSIIQPLISKVPEPGHLPKDILNLAEFISLLREEEDYYAGEQHHTNLIITRLRKIFYDQWGWNKELIKGAASIETRYEAKIVHDKDSHGAKIARYTDFKYDPKHREVVYTKNDRIYGDKKAGEPTFIYLNNHQECKLPDGTFCDIAHVLSGLDAFNYPQVVTPLPHFLRFLIFLFPHVSSNMDMATWLGDIGSSAGGFLFTYLGQDKKELTPSQEQEQINIFNPGSDMLGNIDAYVIANSYNVSTNDGMRFTEILEDYYLKENQFRKNRISIFCKVIGLGKLQGDSFENETQWLKKYRKELRDETTFQIYSLSNGKLISFFLPIWVWMGGYKKIIKINKLLDITLDSFKEEIKKENL